MRLVLLISILAATLQADPVTVIETKSAFGLTSLFYSYDVPASPGPVTAQIFGNASCPGQGCSGDQYTTATIDLAMDLYTSGPIRDGIALLQLDVSSGGNAAGAVQEGGAIGPYSIGIGTCGKEQSCHKFGYFPFELGVPFTINLTGLAYGFPPYGGAGFGVSASLQLYELPPPDGGPAGAPVQINLVPEPGSAGLAFTGLSALVLFAVRRRKNLPSI
jgi:hypothetical protein